MAKSEAVTQQHPFNADLVQGTSNGRRMSTGPLAASEESLMQHHLGRESDALSRREGPHVP